MSSHWIGNQQVCEYGTLTNKTLLLQYLLKSCTIMIRCVYKSCTSCYDSISISLTLAVNPCARNNGNCSHLCLLSTTSGGRTCACPDGRGLRLAANLRDCISSLPTQPPTTTATVAPTTPFSCLPACRNGGACIATNLCSCPTGWTGSYCQTRNTLLHQLMICACASV